MMHNQDYKNTLVVLRKTSLVDFPGRLSAVLFFPGCNLRCPWCQNGALLTGKPPENSVSLEKALSVIKRRSPLIKGVVLSGGEPTLFPGLGALITCIKTLGLAVKLDTNGLLPGVLETLLKDSSTRPDYIAMDLKLAPDRYASLLPKGKHECPEELAAALQKSASLIRASGVEHEFRTLNLPKPVFTETDKASLAALALGSPWVFRPLVTGACLDPAWNTEV